MVNNIQDNLENNFDSLVKHVRIEFLQIVLFSVCVCMWLKSCEMRLDNKQ